MHDWLQDSLADDGAAFLRIAVRPNFVLLLRCALM